MKEDLLNVLENTIDDNDIENTLKNIINIVFKYYPDISDPFDIILNLIIQYPDKTKLKSFIEKYKNKDAETMKSKKAYKDDSGCEGHDYIFDAIICHRCKITPKTAPFSNDNRTKHQFRESVKKDINLENCTEKCINLCNY